MSDKGGATLSDKKRRMIANRTEGWIIKHLPEFIDTLADLARGVWEEKVDGRSGETKIYQRVPDRQALEFLIEHGLGKATQKTEVTGPEGGPLEILPWMPAPPKNLPTVSKGQLTDGSTIDAEARRSSSEEEDQEAQEGKENEESN